LVLVKTSSLFVAVGMPIMPLIALTYSPGKTGGRF
jgi:hypothetical protein